MTSVRDTDLRRCRKCDKEKPLKEGFYVDRRWKHGAPGHYKYVCKACNKTAWSARGVEYRRQGRFKLALQRAKGRRVYVVLEDPTGVYPQGGRFEAKDFRITLKGGGWPVGMIVLRLWDNTKHKVIPWSEKLEVIHDRGHQVQH